MTDQAVDRRGISEGPPSSPDGATIPAAGPFGEATARERLEDILIIDADVHVHESPRALIPYCDMPWRKALAAIADVPERYLDLPGFSPGESGSGYEAQFPGNGEPLRVVSSPQQMHAELATLFVDAAILFPDHLLKLALLTQADYAASLARAFNSWLTAEWCSKELGLFGCIIASPQDPASAASEIEKYADSAEIVGIYLPCAGVDPLWGNRKYDPVYAAAQSAGLPVLLHAVNVTHPVFPFNNQGFDTLLARHALSHPFSVMANLTSMVTTGVPVRFPTLRVASLEAGLSWIPFLMNRLDKEFMERRRDVPFLNERPSHYLKQYFYATQPIEEPDRMKDIATLIDLYDGEDITIFASDWPHHDFDHPMKLGQVPLSPVARKKIFGGNALRLFGLTADPERNVRKPERQ